MVICCLSMVELELEFGSVSFSTLGLARVETMRKNSRRKNMMSFNDSVLTSAASLCLRLIFMSAVLRLLFCWLLEQVDEFNRSFFHLMDRFIQHRIQNVIADECDQSDNKPCRAREHFLV